MVNTVNVGKDGVVIRVPGASLEDLGSALARSAGAAAAGSIAGAVILTSMTIADVEARLGWHKAWLDPCRALPSMRR